LVHVALDLRALRHPRRLARYVLLRRRLAAAIDDESLRLLPIHLDARAVGPLARDTAQATRDLPLFERWASRARVLPDTCLYRAAARYVVLRAVGVAPRLVVGAASDGAVEAGLIGHAWVEVDGAPYLEPDDPRARFRTTWSHPDLGGES
jgi:hypothetical protein